MKIKVTVELSKSDRRCIARFRNERYGEHGRLASRKDCKEAVLHAVDVFLKDQGAAGDDVDRGDEGGD